MSTSEENNGYTCMLYVCCSHNGIPKIAVFPTKFASKEAFRQSEAARFNDLRQRLCPLVARQIGGEGAGGEFMIVAVYSKPLEMLVINP